MHESSWESLGQLLKEIERLARQELIGYARHDIKAGEAITVTVNKIQGYIESPDIRFAEKWTLKLCGCLNTNLNPDDMREVIG